VAQTSFCLFGTPGAERNLGVGALRDSTVSAVLGTLPDSAMVVFDDGWGVRSDGSRVTRAGARLSRRWHRPESFAHMRASIALRGLGNRGAQFVRRATAVLDVSGGDSFSDLYGDKRFRTVAWPKHLALAARRPLVLLPQTYGPFRAPDVRAEAAWLLRGAAQVWARDRRSKEVADELLGSDQARLGVDMAFGLPVTPMSGAALAAWLGWADARPEPIAGININGLLVNQSDATSRYGVTPHHAEEMTRVARTILETSEWRVVLVPHVLGGSQAVDADSAVCAQIAEDLRAEYGAPRVWLADGHTTAGQAKSVIARCNWFTGARMHSTIAALSSGVPTGGVAYSDKMVPVFDELGQTTTVDARALTSTEIVGRLVDFWRGHAETAQTLAARLPALREQVAAQAAQILAVGTDRLTA